MRSLQSPLHSDHGALVICNGGAPPDALLRRLARRAGMIVAADGGANIARRAGLAPDLIIGDLDSITPGTRRRFAGTPVIRVRRQDNTDLEKALDHLAGAGIRSCVVAGATGLRLDFTLANLSVAWLYRRRLQVLFAGDGWWAAPLDRENSIVAPEGCTASLLPWGRCAGVTLRGLRYPLTNASFTPGMVAVSNVVRRSPFRVRVRSGRLLLVVLEGRRRAR